MSAPHPPGAPRPSVGLRILAGVAGAAILLLAVITSLGVALIAPIAIAGAAWWMRRRGKRLSLLGSWVAGTAALAVAFMLGMSLAFTLVPELDFERMTTQAMVPPPDTAEFVKRMERMRPAGSAQADSAVARVLENKAVVRAMLVVGLAFAGVVYGGLFGTVAWGGTTLLVYAATGRATARATGAPPDWRATGPDE